MLPTESELEVVPISQKGHEEDKGGGGKKVLNRHAVDAKGKAYSLARDFVKSTLAITELERVDVLHYIGLGRT